MRKFLYVVGVLTVGRRLAAVVALVVSFHEGRQLDAESKEGDYGGITVTRTLIWDYGDAGITVTHTLISDIAGRSTTIIGV
jgi:hypothetical protein